jgi:NDP-sugar pyrophosphorylase family protein
MKYILFSPLADEKFYPLTESISDFMFPLVNKKLVEHSLDLFYKEGIKELTLFLRNFPMETRSFLGSGERWGENINYKILSGNEPFSIQQILLDEEDDLFFFPINYISNLPIKQVINFQVENSLDYFVIGASEGNEITLSDMKEENCKLNYPFFLSKESIQILKNQSLKKKLEDGLKSLLSEKIKTGIITVSHKAKQISNLEDLLKINIDLLQNPLSTTIFPGLQVEPGLYISPGAKIPPHNKSFLLVGMYSEIKGNLNLAKNSIIGNNCIIEESSIIENSLIYDNTFIGSQLEIKDAIIFNKYLIKPVENLITYIEDDFILGNITKDNTSYSTLQEFIHRIIALFLFVLFLPITTILFLINLLLPQKNKLIKTEEVQEYDRQKDLGGKPIYKSVNLYHFTTGIRILDKLPSLWQVIIGKQLLVGIGPRIETNMPGLASIYIPENLSPPGIIRLWEVEKQNVVEEKIVSELYYSKNRTFLGDIRILFRYFTNR